MGYNGKETQEASIMKEIVAKKGPGGNNPFWKKWWFWAIVVVVVIAVSSNAKIEDSLDGEPVANVSEERSTEESIETEKPIETEKADEDEKPAQEPTERPKEAKHRKGMDGVSDKNIKDTDIHLGVTKVRNDATEKWRISTIAENIDFVDYALSYYNEYFSDDSEVHAIVNFTKKTTTKITVVADQIDVSILEYVDKEEHDAKILFSGNLLKEYLIYKDNGDVEKVK